MYKYDFGGWINLCEEFFVPLQVENKVDWKEKVTYSNKIKIYLDQNRCHTAAVKHYHKIYISNGGFTMGKIFNLIFDTYKSSIDDIYEHNEEVNSDLALISFEFDGTTNSVYPNCDS